MAKKWGWTLVSYSGQEPGDLTGEKHIFHAKTKREAVGLMKTMIDNFDPVHIDILKTEYKEMKPLEGKKQ